MAKITETPSKYRDLEQKSVTELLEGMNREDRTVPEAVAQIIPALSNLVGAIVEKMKNGGRLFYIGAGTSGRLGVLDASECPPTFGVPDSLVVGLIAGGDGALRNSVEQAEDDTRQAWLDLSAFNVNGNDIVLGVTASGTTTYVVHGLKDCQANQIVTASLACNPNAMVSQYADHPLEVITGPEFLTGSTRMKAGTAQKMVLNMISTSVMIRLGKVLDNRMVDMQLNNEKLLDRGTRMIIEKHSITYEKARNCLVKHGSVRSALDWLAQND